jgi:hypothetical protein
LLGPVIGECVTTDFRTFRSAEQAPKADGRRTPICGRSPISVVSGGTQGIQMQSAASISRIAFVVVSFLYMILLLPHLAHEGVQLSKMSSGWYVAALLVAFGWVPGMALHLRSDQLNRQWSSILSFLPALFAGCFFILLFSFA